MLKEYQNILQDSKKYFRRWFSDDDMDLFIWLDEKKEIQKFQLCYDKNSNEQAITWDKIKGFLYYQIDNNESAVTIDRSPLLVMQNGVPITQVIQEFINHSVNIESEIRDFVLRTLSNLN